MKSIWIWIGVIVILTGGYFVFGKKGADTDGAIRIGYVGPFTGPVAGTSGEDVANGWKLAIKKRGAVGGKPVEIIYEDDACDPKQAASAAQKLLAVDKVNIVVNGVCSGSMLSIAPITETAKAILFTPVSTSPKISAAGDYVFRTSASSVATAEAMAGFATKRGYKNVAILFENAEYTVGIKDAFTAAFVKIPGNAIIAAEGVNLKESDMRTQLVKIAALRPDMLVAVMNSTVSAAAFLAQNKNMNGKTPVLGNEYFGFSTIVENPDAEGIYITQYEYDGTAPAFKSYIDEYAKEYGKKPSQEIYAALPFDGYNVLANAIEKCGGTDSDCVRDALYGISGYQGITGLITIDAKGDSARAFEIRQIKTKVLTNT